MSSGTHKRISIYQMTPGRSTTKSRRSSNSNTTSLASPAISSLATSRWWQHNTSRCTPTTITCSELTVISSLRLLSSWSEGLEVSLLAARTPLTMDQINRSRCRGRGTPSSSPTAAATEQQPRPRLITRRTAYRTQSPWIWPNRLRHTISSNHRPTKSSSNNSRPCNRRKCSRHRRWCSRTRPTLELAAASTSHTKTTRLKASRLVWLQMPNIRRK